MKSLIVPGWATYDPLHARRRWVTFHIRAAALYHNENASVKTLSEACGFHAGTLHGYMREGSVPESVCLTLDELTHGIVPAARINHPES